MSDETGVRDRVDALLRIGYSGFVVVSTVLFLLTLVVALMQIGIRSVPGNMSRHFLWTSTIARYLFIYTIFFAIIIAEVEEEHIQVEYFRDRLATVEDGLYDQLINLSVIVISGTLAASAAVQARNFWQTGSADLLWFRAGWLYLPVLVGFGLVFLYKSAKLAIFLQGKIRERQMEKYTAGTE